jgi:hypothetical protein
MAGVFNVPKIRIERKIIEKVVLLKTDMILPWYECVLWFAAIVAKAVLFWKCLPIRKLAFLQVFTVYGLVYELLALFVYFQHPYMYNQSIWMLDFIKYFIFSLLITQLATINESRNFSLIALLSLCTLTGGLLTNVQLSNTQALLRLARFVDGICIGLTFTIFVQKMDKLYKNIAIGLSGILAGDFICSYIQSIDQWNHWDVVRPLYAASYLIFVLVMILLIRFGLSDNFQYVQAEGLSLPAGELAPAQQYLLSPELYLP